MKIGKQMQEYSLGEMKKLVKGVNKIEERRQCRRELKQEMRNKAIKEDVLNSINEER